MSTTFGDNHPNQTERKNLKQTNHLSHYTWSETDLGHFTSLYILRQISTWGGVKDLPLLSVCHQAVVLPWRSSAPVWKRWKHHSGWQFSGCATRGKPKVPCFPKCVFSPGSMEKTVGCADCFNFAVFPWTNSLNTKCLFSIVFIGLHSLLFIIYACWHPDFFDAWNTPRLIHVCGRLHCITNYCQEKKMYSVGRIPRLFVPYLYTSLNPKSFHQN